MSRHRSQLPSLDLDAMGGDLGISDDLRQFPQMACARDSLNLDIRFRSEPHQSQTLYEGEGEEDTSDGDLPRPQLGGRKQSLVKVEDYRPHQTEKHHNSGFNPYRASSWSSRPEEFNFDLRSPDISPRNSYAPQDAALPPNQASALTNTAIIVDKPATPESDTSDSLPTHRTLGGKRIVNAGEWRRNLYLSSNSRFTRVDEKSSVDEKFSSSNVYLDKLPEPNVVEVQGRSEHGFLSQASLLMAPALVMLLDLATMAYLAARLVYLVLADLHDRSSYFGAWAFWAVEFMCAWRTGVALTKSTFALQRKGIKKLRVQGDSFLPTVDVLIIATGQPDQVVVDTAMAASRLDWPIDRIRVLVIDDTSSPELQRRLESYASHKALHMSYHRRVKAPASHERDTFNYKASLINFGMTETRLHGRHSGDLTLVLEAECLPEPDILRAMAPYMLRDPNTALVRSRQGFYNLPIRIGGSFGTFMNAVEPPEDARSGFLMRRAAIDTIGGFPTASSVEDRQLECLLEGKGYSTKYLEETLQYGLVPDSFVVHLRSRMARYNGSIRTARRLKLFFSTRLTKMTFFSRIMHLYQTLQLFWQLDLFISMAIFPFALFFGEFLVPVLHIDQLYLLIRCLFIVTVLRRIHELCFNLPTGQLTGDQLQRQWMFLAPYQLITALSACLPLRWQSKAKGGWTADTMPRERDVSRKQPTIRRARSILACAGTWLHLLVAAAVMACIVYTLAVVLKPLVQDQRSSKQAYLMLLLTFAWPSLPWMNGLASSMVALSYILSSPTVPSRDHLIHREPITGIARPLPERSAVYPHGHSSMVEVVVSVFSTLYVTVLFVLTFTDLLRV